MIAYGMGELLDAAISPAALKNYEQELRELVTALHSQGRRSVICLPPTLNDDIEGTAARPVYKNMCEVYAKRRPDLVAMLKSVAASEQLPVIDMPELRTSYFESGTYLSAASYKAFAGHLAEAILHDSPVASRANEKALYDLASEGERLFFDMHRPQNETYLLLFRKHEQGNNAVELGQFRPLLAEKQLQLLHAAAARSNRAILRLITRSRRRGAEAQ